MLCILSYYSSCDFLYTGWTKTELLLQQLFELEATDEENDESWAKKILRFSDIWRIQRGTGYPEPLENYKWLLVSLETLEWTTLSSNWHTPESFFRGVQLFLYI